MKRKIGIQQSIYLGVAVLGLLILVFGGTMFLVTLNSMSTLANASSKGVKDLGAQTSLVRNLALVHSNILWIADEHDPESRQVRLEVTEGLIAELQGRLTDCGKACAGVKAKFLDYAATWDSIVKDCAHKHDFSNYRQAIVIQLNPNAEKLFDNLDRVASEVSKQADQNFQNSMHRSYLYLLGSGIGLLLIFVAIVTLFVFIKLHIINPLGNLRNVMGQVKQTLDVRLDIDKIRVNEIKEISSDFNEMIFSLKANEVTIEHQQAIMIQTSKMSSLGEMSAGVAHEINNPLAIISGNLQQMQSRMTKFPEAQLALAKYIDKALKSAERISKIVMGLRAFSRNANEDPKTEIPLPKIVEETIEICRERYSKFGIELEVSSVPSIMLPCRESQIVQVIVNMLNNAVDAVMELPPDQHWVKITIAKDVETLRIYIRDGGHGIPQDIAEKIMQPFFTTKEVGKGTGLGLSISVGIIEEHGGTLYLDRKDPNTCFVIELPLIREALAA